MRLEPPVVVILVAMGGVEVKLVREGGVVVVTRQGRHRWWW